MDTLTFVISATSVPLRREVDGALRAFVDRQRPVLLGIGDELGPLLAALDALLAGGKRLRPAFAYWAWRGAGGADADRTSAVAAAASLELLQASALIHDDVMDASDTRRGQPSVHRRLETMAGKAGWPGAAGPFGTGAAILLGDLCLAWSAEMYDRSGLPGEALDRGRRIYDLMRTEVMCGQYLDLLEQTRGAVTVEAALRVVEYKSAKYTIERPLHLGAALAGAGEPLPAALSAYGLPLGIAFQLRDDVLGVFGDPAETGKPAGDDLREGKRTVLIAHTLERATPAQRQKVRRLLGDPALTEYGVAEFREIITATGALEICEQMISTYAGTAATALAKAPLTAEAKAALETLTVAATTRRH
jgi:geranylgeranyl diphosphate synthase type I